MADDEGHSGPIVLIAKPAKIACNTCASGKRKCDGVLPVCGRCTALRKQCLWPAAAAQAVRNVQSKQLALASRQAASTFQYAGSPPDAMLTSSSAAARPQNDEMSSIGETMPSGSSVIFLVLPSVLLPWHRLSLAPLSRAALPILAWTTSEESSGRGAGASVPASSSGGHADETAGAGASSRPRARGGHKDEDEDEEDDGQDDISTDSKDSHSSDSHDSDEGEDGHASGLVALRDAFRMLWALAGGLRVPRAWLLGLQREAEDKRVEALVKHGAPPVDTSETTSAWAVLSGPAWDNARPNDALRVVLSCATPAWLVVYGAAGKGVGDDRNGHRPGSTANMRATQVLAQAVSHIICNTAALQAFGWTAAEVMQRARGQMPLRWLLPTHACIARRCLVDIQARLSGERLVTCRYTGVDGHGDDAEHEDGTGAGASADDDTSTAEAHSPVSIINGYLLTRQLAVAGSGVVSSHASLADTIDAALAPAISASAARAAYAAHHHLPPSQSLLHAFQDEGSALDVPHVLEGLDDAAVYTPCTGVEHVVSWYTDPQTAVAAVSATTGTGTQDDGAGKGSSSSGSGAAGSSSAPATAGSAGKRKQAEQDDVPSAGASSAEPVPGQDEEGKPSAGRQPAAAEAAPGPAKRARRAPSRLQDSDTSTGHGKGGRTVRHEDRKDKDKEGDDEADTVADTEEQGAGAGRGGADGSLPHYQGRDMYRDEDSVDQPRVVPSLRMQAVFVTDVRPVTVTVKVPAAATATATASDKPKTKGRAKEVPAPPPAPEPAPVIRPVQLTARHVEAAEHGRLLVGHVAEDGDGTAWQVIEEAQAHDEDGDSSIETSESEDESPMTIHQRYRGPLHPANRESRGAALAPGVGQVAGDEDEDDEDGSDGHAEDEEAAGDGASASDAHMLLGHGHGHGHGHGDEDGTGAAWTGTRSSSSRRKPSSTRRRHDSIAEAQELMALLAYTSVGQALAMEDQAAAGGRHGKAKAKARRKRKGRGRRPGRPSCSAAGEADDGDAEDEEEDGASEGDEEQQQGAWEVAQPDGGAAHGHGDVPAALLGAGAQAFDAAAVTTQPPDLPTSKMTRAGPRGAPDAAHGVPAYPGGPVFMPMPLPISVPGARQGQAYPQASVHARPVPVPISSQPPAAGIGPTVTDVMYGNDWAGMQAQAAPVPVHGAAPVSFRGPASSVPLPVGHSVPVPVTQAPPTTGLGVGMGMGMAMGSGWSSGPVPPFLMSASSGPHGHYPGMPLGMGMGMPMGMGMGMPMGMGMGMAPSPGGPLMGTGAQISGPVFPVSAHVASVPMSTAAVAASMPAAAPVPVMDASASHAVAGSRGPHAGQPQAAGSGAGPHGHEVDPEAFAALVEIAAGGPQAANGVQGSQGQAGVKR